MYKAGVNQPYSFFFLNIFGVLYTHLAGFSFTSCFVQELALPYHPLLRRTHCKWVNSSVRDYKSRTATTEHLEELGLFISSYNLKNHLNLDPMPIIP